MSTDRKRLSSAIQRIAKEDPEIRQLIDEFKNRGGVGSESVTVEGADDGRQICCDGSTSSNRNPGASARDPSAGGQNGLDPDDPANLGDMGPGMLAGLTDCDTGEPVCLEGSDWIPPDGWDSPTTPPIDPSYLEGEMCYYASPNETYGKTKSEALPSGFQMGGYNVSTGENFDMCRGLSPTDCGSENHNVTCGGCFAGGELYNFMLVICPQDYEEKPMEEYLLDSWPEDGCINLALKNGKWVASKYDPDVSNGGAGGSSPYLKGKGSVSLCDGNGNQVDIAPSGSVAGGWKSISPNNPGDGYLYNGKGEQIARISGSEYSDPSV